MDRLVINSDFALWAAPLKMGFPSAILKMALDKHLPLIHPYMVVDQGEAHHLKRYESYPRVGLLVEKESETDDRDLDLIRQLFSRTALNFKSRLDFLETTETDPGEVCQQILVPLKAPHTYQRGLGPVPGEVISPPKRITVFNGSPRGKNGNTPVMLRELMKGFGGDYKIHHLIMTRDLEDQAQAFRDAECVWLGFPLYTDGMPGVVKSFIEALEPYKGADGNPPMGYLVQSGFPEGLHSRYVERYNARLTELLGVPYLGTIVKGNGEGIRLMSDEMNQPLFENLHSLGGNIAGGKPLNPEILANIAKPERFPAILGPIFRIFLRTKMAHRYFDTMLHENEAFERVNDRPFVDG
jgi:multimeric flavodoxin WrbA